jgi:hypothetical protein
MVQTDDAEEADEDDDNEHVTSFVALFAHVPFSSPPVPSKQDAPATATTKRRINMYANHGFGFCIVICSFECNYVGAPSDDLFSPKEIHVRMMLGGGVARRRSNALCFALVALSKQLLLSTKRNMHHPIKKYTENGGYISNFKIP